MSDHPPEIKISLDENFKSEVLRQLALLNERSEKSGKWQDETDHRLFGNGRPGLFERLDTEFTRQVTDLEVRLRALEVAGTRANLFASWTDRGVGAAIAALIAAVVAHFIKK
jgi:hypothetical protein